MDGAVMRDLLSRFFAGVAKAIAPSAIAPQTPRGGFYVDSYRRVRQPTPTELLLELKNTAWTCASLNASVCASYPPKLYVTTSRHQPEPKCHTAPVPAAEQKRLRSHPHLGLYTRGAAVIEEVTEHPLLTLLRKVNPVHNSFDLWELTTLYQESHGSAYWLLRFDAFHTPSEIWILPSQCVTPWREQNSPNLVDYYRYLSSGIEQRFAPEEVIHFRYPDPKDPYHRGFSPLQAAFEQVALTSEYAAMKRATFDNQAVPSVVISPQEVISPDERDRLEEQWNQKFRKGGSGRALVAESSLKVELIRQQMGDLAQLAEQGATKEDIANAFHVPLAYLTKDTNMANIQASAYQHMTLAIRPRLRRRDEKLNEQLIPLYDPTGRLFVASEDPVPESQEQALQQQEMDLKTGVKTINEVRQERGLPPVEWGRVPWLPLNWKPTNDHTARQVIETDPQE